MSSSDAGPQIVVLSSLFPSRQQPGAGLFVRERMFRVGARLGLTVVSPRPWFPLQSWLRRLRPGARPETAAHESQRGFEVWFPRFLSLPLVLRRLDGLAMAVGAWPRLRRLKRQGRLDILDAHFGYPDGYAAGLLGRWLGVPVTITLRGTEPRHAADPVLGPLLAAGLKRATRVFAVSESLRQVALRLGVEPSRVQVVGNGVDLARFRPLPRQTCRQALGISPAGPVLVTVGGLCERKGFHRVIELLPRLLKIHPGLCFLAVGGPSPEGDWTERLHAQCAALGVADSVRFTGPVEPDELSRCLSAADLFVLPTRNEGWANVLLEAMACRLPVVATDVGGNAEVINHPDLGCVVPFGDADGLFEAIRGALERAWNGEAIRQYAERNTWDRRVEVLEAEFRALSGARAQPKPSRE